MRQRIRVRFTKTGDLQWLSHHDLMRLWERALRRSGLPIAFSEGFNPRPRLSFPLALGIGISSRDEVVEIEMSRWTTAQAVAEALKPCLPTGMEVTRLELLPPHEKGQVSRVSYRVALSAEEAARAEAALDALWPRARWEIVRQRNQKTIDLKPYVLVARVEDGVLTFSFRVTPEGTARPEEFCALLGLSFGAVPTRIEKISTDIPSQAPAAPPRRAGPRRPPRAGRAVR